MKEVLSAENLCFGYNDTLVLKNVNFTVYENDFIGIFGPNGGGKSTLLALIMGFLKPTSGSIALFGKNPTENRGLIGWVPQHFHYDQSFPISTMEVVLTGRLSKAKLWGGYSKEDRKKALDSLEKVEMLKYQKTPFSQLSGGEAQRVLIARSLASDPRLLLLDEPTASVDLHNEQKIYSFLETLKEEMTILMVTHDLKVAIDYVKKVFCVQTTLSTPSPQELCRHYAFGLYHPPLNQEKS